MLLNYNPAKAPCKNAKGAAKTGLTAPFNIFFPKIPIR